MQSTSLAMATWMRLAHEDGHRKLAHDWRFNMNQRTFAGSAFTTAGTAVVVAAIMVAAIGTGGLSYMGTNPEALELVAGCALVSGALLCVGLLLITLGLTRAIDHDRDSAEDQKCGSWPPPSQSRYDGRSQGTTASASAHRALEWRDRPAHRQLRSDRSPGLPRSGAELGD